MSGGILLIAFLCLAIGVGVCLSIMNKEIDNLHKRLSYLKAINDENIEKIFEKLQVLDETKSNKRTKKNKDISKE